MTRGIHLKQLKKQDLLALGLPESALEGPQAAEPPWSEHPAATERRAAELARELRAGLEEVLELLEEALKGIDRSPGEGRRPETEEALPGQGPWRGALASPNPRPRRFDLPSRALDH